MGERDGFSARLKAERRKRGWTQKMLGAKARLTISAVSHFETGTRLPSYRNMQRLADALSTSVDYLLGYYVRSFVGPNEQQLLGYFGEMSGSDQQVILELSRLLAARNGKG